MVTLRLSIVRWRLVAIGACYVLALVAITNMFFGTVVFFGVRGSTNPARTAAYDTRLPLVPPVDPVRIAAAVTEATGGPPTIGLPLPATVAPVTAARVTVATVSTTAGPGRQAQHRHYGRGPAVSRGRG